MNVLPTVALRATDLVGNDATGFSVRSPPIGCSSNQPKLTEIWLSRGTDIYRDGGCNILDNVRKLAKDNGNTLVEYYRDMTSEALKRQFPNIDVEMLKNESEESLASSFILQTECSTLLNAVVKNASAWGVKFPTEKHGAKNPGSLMMLPIHKDDPP